MMLSNSPTGTSVTTSATSGEAGAAFVVAVLGLVVVVTDGAVWSGDVGDGTVIATLVVADGFGLTSGAVCSVGTLATDSLDVGCDVPFVAGGGGGVVSSGTFCGV